jgi:RimJ/RimL family protein N-acetyltransferase
MLRLMESKDIRDVAHIHATSWAPHEISVKLGPTYLRMFYSFVVNSPHSFGYVWESEGKIAGYATGFQNYQVFNEELKNKNFFKLGITVVMRFLGGKLSFADIKNLMADDNKLRKARFPQYHLGALALANEFKQTSAGKDAVKGTINAVLDHLAEAGYPGCWGLCNEVNMPMRKYLLKLGFEEIDIIEEHGRNVVLYEKEFGASEE